PIPAFATFTDHGDGTATLHFAPGTGDRGIYPITLRVQDGGDGNRGTILAAEESFILTVTAPNDGPTLEFVGDRVAVIGETTSFTLHASDPDFDVLSISADDLPTGAKITPGASYGTAVFTWTPAPADAGSHSVTFRVKDNGQGDPSQSLADAKTIRVVARSSDSTPALDSIAAQVIVVGGRLSLTLSAADADGDPLTYSGSGLPEGATLDPKAGVFVWTPREGQAGSYGNIIFSVSDGSRSASRPVHVTVTSANHAPTVSAPPTILGREGVPLKFTVFADDLDRDPLIFTSLDPLPFGATLDAKTGSISWTPGFDQAGDYPIRIRVQDPGGLAAVASLVLHVDNVDRPPTLAVFDHAVVLGQSLDFQLRGSDPDLGASLIYSAQNLPQGATLDPTSGAFHWTPGPAQAGDRTVTFTVSDGEASIDRAVTIRALLQPPSLAVSIELTPNAPAVPGQTVLVHVLASSPSGIVSTSLLIGGQSVAIDALGRGLYTPTVPGRIAIEATVTDADGYSTVASVNLKVRDPNDLLAPVVALDPALVAATIGSAIEIHGTISDVNLDVWNLEVAPFGTNAFSTLATGTQSILDGMLSTLDPNALANGFYRLRLTATDLSSRTTVSESVVEVNSSVKMAQYQRQETDLSVVLGSTTIDLVRQYDSLNSATEAEFGLGWRLANRDTLIQTNVPTTGLERVGVFNPFRIGTRIYLTLPDGRRVGFTFTPIAHTVGGVTYQSPAFQADPGVEYTLSSAEAKLSLVGNRLYDLRTGRAYNPENPLFTGPQYTLSGPDGTTLQLSAARGVEAEILPSGQTLIFSDSGITASTGESVGFVHDAVGRLTAITATDGSQVLYSYDDSGRLLAARSVSEGRSSRYGYESQVSRRLNLVVSPDAGASVAIAYLPTPELLPIAGDLGSSGQFVGTTRPGMIAAGETDRFVFSLRTSEIDSTSAQIVYLGIAINAAPASSLQPAVPRLDGLTPIVSRRSGGSAFALFAVFRSGLERLDLAGIAGTSGDYSLHLFIAGDVNEDGRVDALDANLLAAALGKTAGQAGYLLAADADRDGILGASDVQFLGLNNGFAANKSPAASPASAITHVDVPVVVSLVPLAQDPDGDPIHFHVVDSTHGRATIGPGGTSVSFLPDSGYSGPAQFRYQADDGYGSSAIATVSVTVSAAALVRLDFQARVLQLDPGHSRVLVPVGDFTDQAGVVLPGNYVAFMTSANGIASISADGRLNALSTGDAEIHMARGSLQAATVVRVGTQATFNTVLLASVGLTVSPQAVTLAVGDYRQLHVSLATSLNLEAASTDTTYVVGDTSILTVTPDGRLIALSPGTTSVTIINGPAETTIPIKVAIPHSGPTLVGPEGGAVQGSDGSLVEVPPGALTGNQTVSIAPVTEASLPMATPTANGLDFAAGFVLDVGPKDANLPLRLSIPVGPDVAVGTQIWFLHAGLVDDGSATPHMYWQVAETGTVDADGVARTTSPPYPGVMQGGYYIASKARAREALAEVHLQVQLALSAIGGDLGFSILGGGLSASVAAGDLSGVLGTAAMPLIAGSQRLQVIVPTPEGLSQVTPFDVTIEPGRLNTIKLTLPAAPAGSTTPASPPRITGVSLQIPDTGPELVITGSGFAVNNPVGAPALGPDDVLRVQFQRPDGAVAFARTSPNSTANELHVPIPGDLAIGTVKVQVIRPQYVAGSTNSLKPSWAKKLLASDPVQLDVSGHYVFATLADADQVAVINGDPESPVFNTIVARIGLGDPNVHGAPSSIALTPDNTRAYVTLALSNRIAVIDALALREIDVDPSTPAAIDEIVLPEGAYPDSIVIDPKGNYAYVADRVSYASGLFDEGVIYVIDVNPRSPRYNSYTQISVGPARYGLRQLALDSDGQRLYVAAPSTRFRPGSPGDPGHILVVDVNSDAHDPLFATKYLKQIGEIPIDQEPRGITASSDPLRLTFTNSRDVLGTGVIVANSDRTAWTVTYTPLALGQSDSPFGVHTAQSLVILPDLSYAFVSAIGPAFNPAAPWTDQSTGTSRPTGGNIGIIRDPFGPNRRLIAATRPVPFGYPDALSLSADGNYLYAAYRAAGIVQVYDIRQMLAVIDAKGTPPGPVGEIIPTAFDLGQAQQINGDADGNGGPLNYEPIDDINPDARPLIDVKADFRAYEQVDYDENNQPIMKRNGKPQTHTVFGVPNNDPHKLLPPIDQAYGKTNPNAPIPVGGYPTGLAVQSDFLKLVGPLQVTTASLTPTFLWNTNGKKLAEAKLYLSVLPRGSGLFPEDSDPKADLNANRIVNGLPGVWNRNPDGTLIDTANPSDYVFKLPTSLKLTAGQAYFWGIIGRNTGGGIEERSSNFLTAPTPAKAPQQFTSVTLLTPGMPIPYLASIYDGETLDLARTIAGTSKGFVFRNDPATGDWLPDPSNPGATLAGSAGHPVVLVANWSVDASINDSGFAEAAADALFADLVQLDRSLGGKLFASPLHLIGLDRGASVNSEIAQRLGTSFPGTFPDLQMTSLDAPLSAQGSLNVPLSFLAQILSHTPGGKALIPSLVEAVNSGKLNPDFSLGYGDLHDPVVTVWSNVTFADNYWQDAGSTDKPTLTINGLEVAGADVNVALGGRAGFTQDDPGLGHGGPDRRVLSWYAGTADLGLSQFPNSLADPNFAALQGAPEPIDRSQADKNLDPFGGNGIPWYWYGEAAKPLPAGLNASYFTSNANPSEGVGEGWFYSVLGGGAADRPKSKVNRTAVSQDNTVVGKAEAAVPSVFNGRFDAGTRPLQARFPAPLDVSRPSNEEIPGWSFHGGSTADNLGESLVGLIATADAVAAFPAIGAIANLSSFEVTPGFSRVDVLLDLAGIGPSYDEATLTTLTNLNASGKINHALQLGKTTTDPITGLITPERTEITHNRLVIPKDAGVFLFDLSVREADSNDQLHVVLNLDDPSTPGAVQRFDLGTTAVSSKSNGFTPIELAVPPEARGRVGTLTVSLSAPGLVNKLDSVVWVDNLRFSHKITAVEGETVVLPLLVGDSLGVAFAKPQTFSAPAAGQGDSTITILVDGPLADFMKKTKDSDLDLATQTITLAAGSGKTARFDAIARPYAELLAGLDSSGKSLFGPKNMTRDRLYGSKITIIRSDSDGNTSETITTSTYYLYRWVDVVDAAQAVNQTGKTAVFLNTFADGPGGFVREKDIDVSLPISSPTAFSGQNADEFQYGPSVQADTTAVWTFDPSVPAIPSALSNPITRKKDTATISIDGLTIGTLDVSGRATPRTVIDLKEVDFKNELKRVIAALQSRPTGDPDGSLTWYYTIDSGAEYIASEKFVDMVKNYLPGKTFDVNDEYKDVLNPQYDALVAAVKQDYNLTIVGPYNAFDFKSVDAEVVSSWGDIAAGQFGVADYDVNDHDDSALHTEEQLRKYLVSPNLSQAALQYALADALNPNRRNKAAFAISPMIEWDSVEARGFPAANFGEFLADTVSHELGHTFGLEDAYLKVNMPGTKLGYTVKDVYPNDIMASGTGYSPNLTFGTDNTQLLQAAMGLESQSDLPLTAALLTYRQDINTVNSPLGLQDTGTAPNADVTAFNAWRFAPNPPILPPAAPSLKPALPDAVKAAHTGLLNGDFSVGDPLNPNYGWTVYGAGSIAGGMAMLGENSSELTEFSQTFVIPQGTTTLQFTLPQFNLKSNGPNSPPDAFEIALLDSKTKTSLVGTALGLGQTDAFLNVQQTGEVYAGAQVGIVAQGGSRMVTADLRGVPAGTTATLYFDLLGFGSATSTVGLTNVSITGVASPQNHPPVAIDDAFSLTQGMVLNVGVNQGVMANDSDADGDALTARVVSAPTHGTLQLHPDGSFVYTPAPGFHGADEFSYAANDGTVDGNTARVTLSVAAVNTAPLGVDDHYAVNQRGVLALSRIQGVLANDSDVDGDPITARLVSGPSHGSLQLSADGSFRYIPDPAFHGTDRFSYVPNDGTSDGYPRIVSIDVALVNSAPVGVAEGYSTSQATALDVASNQGVLANDTDPEHDALTALLVSGPSHGTLLLHGDGSFTYTPDPGFHGTDGFTYRPKDGSIDGNTAQVTVSVAAVNAPPFGIDDRYETRQGDSLSVLAAQGVLVNDTDPEGDSLSAMLVNGPAHGTLQLRSVGSFVYTPDAGFHGTDRFTYRPNDGSLDGNAAAVTINVQEPVALPPISPSSLPVTTVEGRAFTNVCVASFVDPNPSPSIDDHQATIDWGDGSGTSLGTIAQPGGDGSPFVVSGSHTYPDAKVNGGPGRFTITVRITSRAIPDLVITSTATVADVPISLSGRLDPGSDSGRSNSDGITNVNHPVFSGESEPGSTVRLYESSAGTSTSNLIGQTVTDALGHWSITSARLSDGSHTITAQATDGAGASTAIATMLPNASQGSLVIDTQGPRIVDARFARLTGQVFLTLDDLGAGLDTATLFDASNYALLAEAHRFGSPNTSISRIAAPVGQTHASAAGISSQALAITMNHGKLLPGGIYAFTAQASDPAHPGGLRDLAGNALDGEFNGLFPSGDGLAGGTFATQFASFHKLAFAPQPIVGVTPAADLPGRIPLQKFFKGAVLKRLFNQYFAGVDSTNATLAHSKMIAAVGYGIRADSSSEKRPGHAAANHAVHDAALSTVHRQYLRKKRT
ncbi:MAG: repeat protein, partial [Planctomycetota bacterium]|nr:repeat protein [Planctomycetota bacterium]